MAIHYQCRHCGVEIGELEDRSVASEQLGFHHLTNDERKEMIHYEQNGEMTVKTICEDCQEALERNPEFHQWETFIQ
jgi:hypothetical protein